MIQLSETQKYVLRVLMKAGSISRDELCQKYKIPRTTAYDNLAVLKKVGIVDYVETKDPNRRGRMTKLWRVKNHGEH